eukprot:s5028_g4.t2
MAAPAPFVAGLPGIPDFDQDLDPPGLGASRQSVRGRGESPAKRPKGAGNGTDEYEGQAVLTVQTLQMLLAQQSASLLEAQQAGLRTALKELEDRQEVKMDRLDAKLDEASERTTNLETQLKAAVDRIHVLEERGHQQGGAPGGDHRKHSLVFGGWCDNTRRNVVDRIHVLEERGHQQGGAPGGDHRKHSLVFGGWCDNTRRNVILHQLDESLKHLGLLPHFDSSPFTTGPRRAVALCNFSLRRGEQFPDLRRRMLEVVQEVNKSGLALQGGKRSLWCSFSRSPAERGKASVAGCIKKIVANHRANLLPELDLDYNAGSAWLSDSQVAGMGTPPSGSSTTLETRANLLPELDLDYNAGSAWLSDSQVAGMGTPPSGSSTTLETRAGPAWVDEVRVSKLLRVSRQTIEDEVKAHRF